MLTGKNTVWAAINLPICVFASIFLMATPVTLGQKNSPRQATYAGGIT
ncbi:MAG: hypothetical protein HC866_18970 [Leptolyngbyaceae cyanobacterium RU_5_1]|nr:hypothetical protein [Leptolyngbyaceae cyanobacterium RU_5_1]